MRRLVFAAVLVLAGCGSTSTRTITKTTAATTGTTTTTTTATQTPTDTTVRLPPAPVHFQGAVGGPVVRPRTLELTGDGTLSVEQIQWSSWGGPSARGTGNALYHGCTPNCAAAPTHAAVVSVRLSNVRTCKGRRYYAGVSLRLSSGRLLDRAFVQRSWSPC